MGFKEIIEFTKANMGILPDWFTGIFWHLVSALLLVYLLTLFFKALSSQSFISPIQSVISLLLRVVRSALTGYAGALESPIERPKTKLVAKALGLFYAYSMCIVLFIYLCAIFILFIASSSSMSFVQQFGSIGLLIFLFSLVWYFRVEADREWLALKEQWRVVTGHSEKNP